MNSKPNSCIGCPYYDRPMLWGTGHPKARIAFVGAHPTEKDLEMGSAFSGGSGNILDNGCRRTGINRHREFSTHVVKCLVKPGEEVHWKALHQCKTLLDQELLGLQYLRVTVAVGSVVFKAMTNKDLTTVQNRKKPSAWMRGCPFPVGSKVILPVMDPKFYAMTGFQTSYQCDMDLEKAKRFANGEAKVREVRYEDAPNSKRIGEVFSELRRQGRGGIDIETPEDTPEEELRAGGSKLPIDVIGICASPGEVIGVRPSEYQLVKDFLTDRNSPRIKWYVFNGAFDFYHLGKHFGGLYGVRQFDAMLALNRWRSDLTKKDLGTLLSLFTDLPYTKNLAKIEPIKYQWADVTGVLEGGMRIEQTLEIQGLLKTLEEQDHPLHEDLLDPTRDGLNRMREIGIHADIREVLKLFKVSQSERARYEEMWNKVFPTIDWSSSKQLFTLFTQILKLPVIERMRVKKAPDGSKVRTKSPTCDADALEEYRDAHGSQAAALVLKIREMKHLGDFANIVATDEHVHTAYMVHRQVQFRIQAEDPNIQTLPEELAGFKTRKMVIPDDPDNDMLLAIDASQIELRIYAYLAQAKALLAAMEAGEYIYGAMYEQIYGKSFFNPTGPKTKYNKAPYVTPQEILAAKSGPLGFIYDRGPDSLVQKLGMAPAQAKEVHSGFHKANPEIRAFHARCLKEVDRLGYQTNLWGGRRYFHNSKYQRNEIYSFHGQSNGAELLRDHYLKPCFRHLRSDFGGSRVLLTVHDSMCINVKGGRTNPERLRSVAQFLYDSAEAPIEQMNGFVIPAEVKFGSNWAEMEMFKTHKDANGRTVVE